MSPDAEIVTMTDVWLTLVNQPCTPSRLGMRLGIWEDERLPKMRRFLAAMEEDGYVVGVRLGEHTVLRAGRRPPD